MRLLVLALVLLAAGCVSRQGPEASAPETTAAEETTTESVPAEQTATPADAADGTNYAACADGSCEVFVIGLQLIPFDPPFGITTFEIVRLGGTTAVSIESPERGPFTGQLRGLGTIEAVTVKMEVVADDPTGGIIALFTPL